MGLIKKSQPTSTGNEFMGTQQAAVWLGRSLSTHDVMIRVVEQLMDVVAVQQHMIIGLQQQIGPLEIEGEDMGAQSLKILEGLDELRGKLAPVLKMVDDSCAVLEKMIEK